MFGTPSGSGERVAAIILVTLTSKFSTARASLYVDVMRRLRRCWALSTQRLCAGHLQINGPSRPNGLQRVTTSIQTALPALHSWRGAPVQEFTPEQALDAAVQSVAAFRTTGTSLKK